MPAIRDAVPATRRVAVYLIGPKGGDGSDAIRAMVDVSADEPERVQARYGSAVLAEVLALDDKVQLVLDLAKLPTPSRVSVQLTPRSGELIERGTARLSWGRIYLPGHPDWRGHMTFDGMPPGRFRLVFDVRLTGWLAPKQRADEFHAVIDPLYIEVKSGHDKSVGPLPIIDSAAIRVTSKLAKQVRIVVSRMEEGSYRHVQERTIGPNRTLLLQFEPGDILIESVPIPDGEDPRWRHRVTMKSAQLYDCEVRAR